MKPAKPPPVWTASSAARTPTTCSRQRPRWWGGGARGLLLRRLSYGGPGTRPRSQQLRKPVASSRHRTGLLETCCRDNRWAAMLCKAKKCVPEGPTRQLGVTPPLVQESVKGKAELPGTRQKKRGTSHTARPDETSSLPPFINTAQSQAAQASSAFDSSNQTSSG